MTNGLKKVTFYKLMSGCKILMADGHYTIYKKAQKSVQLSSLDNSEKQEHSYTDSLVT